MPVMVAVPEFVSVTDWRALVVFSGSLANVSDEGASVASGPPCPVPSRATVCVLPVVPPLLSVTVRVP